MIQDVGNQWRELEPWAAWSEKSHVGWIPLALETAEWGGFQMLGATWNDPIEYRDHKWSGRARRGR